VKDESDVYISFLLFPVFKVQILLLVCFRYLQADFKVCIHIVVQYPTALEIHFSLTVAIPYFPVPNFELFVSVLQGADSSSIVLYCSSHDGEEIDRVRCGAGGSTCCNKGSVRNGPFTRFNLKMFCIFLSYGLGQEGLECRTFIC
jgi:hypothetical protein